MTRKPDFCRDFLGIKFWSLNFVQNDGDASIRILMPYNKAKRSLVDESGEMLCATIIRH